MLLPRFGGGLAALLSGDIVRKVSKILPEDIHLLIYA